MAKNQKKKKGFTLVELIVVVAILGILAAVAIPKYAGIKANAAVNSDAATAKQIINAARVQETDTGITVTSISSIQTKYMDAPTSAAATGGNYSLSGGGTSAYEITWTPTKDAAGDYKGKKQTVTENQPFNPNLN